MIDVAANYRRILSRIAEAAAKADRDTGRIRVLAAAKSQSVEAVRAAVAAGVALIGENYVQEAQAKKRSFNERLEWHMIGRLQRNKVRAALQTFDLIESLDSVALARALDKEGRKRGVAARAFVEVNLGGEKSKSGVARDQVGSLIAEAAELPFVRIEGLMTVPPFRPDPEEARPHFRELAALREKLNGLRLPNVKIEELSMGMTHDFPVAVEEGATIVRIGTALFGERDH